ncbi:MAG: HAD family hydrolase [Acidobacteria bacterium]|nr:HAD family hydrolase [Acidobacteriota bacterium]
MIFFDIDGTLIDHQSASVEASLIFYHRFRDLVAFPEATFPAIWEEILNKHFNRFCQGEISLWEQRRARIREVCGQEEMSEEEADARYEVFMRAYEARTQAFVDASPCIIKLPPGRLGIITNGAREQQIGKLRRAGLLEHFTVLVFSEDVGVGKPAARIFLEACRQAGEEPASCVHIGDNVQADVIPSRGLGMLGIHLDRGASQSIPSSVIRTLAELPEMLNSRQGCIVAAT